jgi:hypothetical protein
VKGNADVEYLEYFAEGIQADAAFAMLDVVYHVFSHTSQDGKKRVASTLRPPLFAR